MTVGHNGGPAMDEGVAWRRFAWTKAREALLPTLPVEVVRLRVARAAALGLDYRTYAGVRASTGRDLVAFLFSSNALGLLRPTDALDPERRARLAAVEATRLAAVQPPLEPARVLALAPLDGAGRAPAFGGPWGRVRAEVRALLGAIPPDAVLLVAETAAEREWAEAARLAGAIPGGRYWA